MECIKLSLPYPETPLGNGRSFRKPSFPGPPPSLWHQYHASKSCFAQARPVPAVKPTKAFESGDMIGGGKRIAACARGDVMSLTRLPVRRLYVIGLRIVSGLEYVIVQFVHRRSYIRLERRSPYLAAEGLVLGPLCANETTPFNRLLNSPLIRCNLP